MTHTIKEIIGIQIDEKYLYIQSENNVIRINIESYKDWEELITKITDEN